jgi:hypothetical protein
MKGDLPVAVRGHPRKIVVARFARIDAQFLGAGLHIEIPGAFDVPSGERLAVVPFDALPQLEGQVVPVLTPRPARGEIGHDRSQAVLRHLLVEHDQVVEHPHDRQFGVGELFEHRQARDALGVVDPQGTAALLGECGSADRDGDQQPTP